MTAGALLPRWLQVAHATEYHYDPPVELGHHLGWLVPRNTPLQQVRGWSVQISPAPDEWLQAGVGDDGPVPRGQCHEDAFGNRWLAFSHARPHAHLKVLTRFEAGLLSPAARQPARSPAWESVAAALRYRPSLPTPGASQVPGHVSPVPWQTVDFSLASPCVPAHPSLLALAQQVFEANIPLLTGALRLMARVGDSVRYVPGVTTVNTRAHEALAGGQGVCQDLAHVMLGALRALGLSARYVSGYLLTQPPPGSPRLVGADASHAWVEVWCPAHGWVALDPTNQLTVGTDHVTLAWGRDYADVAPLRGMINGGARTQPQVSVQVEELAY